MMDLGMKPARDLERWVVAALALLALVFLANACIPILRGTPGGDPRIPLHPRMVPLNPMPPKHRPALDDTTEDSGRCGRCAPDTTTEDSW